jgi:hypothetical protein
MHESHVAKCYTKLGTVLEEGLEVFADKVQRKIRLAEREEGHGVAQGTNNNERGGEGV